MTQTGYFERPDYRVDVRRLRNRVRVTASGPVIAETTASLLVDEQDHGLVFYIPKDDVRLELLTPTDDSSHCPYKGDAVYWRLADGAEPIAWGYPEPYREVALLLNHIAFYQDRVAVEIGVANPAVIR